VIFFVVSFVASFVDPIHRFESASESIHRLEVAAGIGLWKQCIKPDSMMMSRRKIDPTHESTKLATKSEDNNHSRKIPNASLKSQYLIRVDPWKVC
jgi:hypothetical protein